MSAPIHMCAHAQKLDGLSGRTLEANVTRVFAIRRQLREGTLDRLSALTALTTLQKSANAKVAALASETVGTVVAALHRPT